MQGWLLLQLLTLLVVANGSAVVAKKLLGVALAHPLDGGALFVDGQPIFRADENHPWRRGVRVGDIHLRGTNGSWMECWHSDRDVCYGWRSFLQLRETQTAPGF